MSLTENKNQRPSYQTKTQDIWKKLQKINPWSQNLGIRTQLLSVILPTVLISIGIISFQSYHSIHDREEKRLQKRLQEQALLTSEITSATLNRSLKIPNFLAIDPFIIDLARTASTQVQRERLNELTTEQLEQRFTNTKLLRVNKTLNEYLIKVGKIDNIPEIFFTEKNGYNVAYSNKTTDFVQNDEKWWQEAKKQGKWISPPVFDESSEKFSLEIAISIKDPNTEEFLGAVKAIMPADRFDVLATYLEHTGLTDTQQVQLIDTQEGKVVETITSTTTSVNDEIVGGEVILEVARALAQTLRDDNDPKQATQELLQKYKLKEFQTEKVIHESELSVLTSSFVYEDKEYYFSTIPDTSWVTVASIDYAEIESAGKELIFPFLISALILGGIACFITIKLANRLSKPIIDLAKTADEASMGNFDVNIIPQGAIETKTLANSFNNLINRIKELLDEEINSLQQMELSKKEVETLAEQQKVQNDAIQQELLKLIMEVEGVSSGDLTVRADITEGEIGIVADFFNSIVENLRDIVTSVKETTNEVNQALGRDELAMEDLQQESIKQSKKIQRMLSFVEEMTQSIEEVAKNTRLVAQISQKASNTAKQGGVAIDKTVKSIVQLRDTVGETGKKVKRLGESSQQISKVISLINQIALQTNLLAINASIEAARAGEEGRGFAVVAEEVGELAAQSAEATKEIEAIVETIQQETAQVVEAMEKGTAEVVEGTRVVARAKKSFGEITLVSRQIDDLLQSISTSTTTQTKTSEMVSNFMQEIAKVSEQSSQSSRKISDSLQETFAKAQKLQNSVETFKID